MMTDGPRSWNECVVVVHTSQDSFGRQQFTMLWSSDYIPGRPEGEYPAPGKFLVRGQCFRAVLKDYLARCRKAFRIVRVIEESVAAPNRR
jgi:hypothetical protein